MARPGYIRNLEHHQYFKSALQDSDRNIGCLLTVTGQCYSLAVTSSQELGERGCMCAALAGLACATRKAPSQWVSHLSLCQHYLLENL